MKNILLIIVISVTLNSCSNKYNELETKLKKEVEEKVVPNLDDPKSFELVSIETKDTVMEHSYAKELKEMYMENIERNNKNIDDYSSGILADTGIANIYKRSNVDYEKNVKSQDSILALPNSIRYINFEVQMRAKNKLNALVLEKLDFIYIPSEQRFNLSTK